MLVGLPLFFVMVLGGEDPIDCLQRKMLANGGGHPLLEQIGDIVARDRRNEDRCFSEIHGSSFDTRGEDRKIRRRRCSGWYVKPIARA